jgi:CheY-like chemotaxis protein
VKPNQAIPSRILVVDDDELFRQMLRTTLVKMGYLVLEARNGREATTLFDQQLPDIVITDLVMPEKEGLETIGELRRCYPEVKIIAMSGGGRISATDYLRIAKAMGANRILAKPFSNDEMVTALNELLGKSLS